MNANDWNPEDGPEPTEDELAEAQAVMQAIQPGVASTTRPSSANVEALVDTALRVRMTVGGADSSTVDAITAAAVAQAIAANSRGRVMRWTLSVVAAAAILVGGITGVRLLSSANEATDQSSLSATTDDLFHAALPNHVGSFAIARIEDSRLRGYRSRLFARGGSR
ncbi:MAG: hypothetical protein Q8Q09_29120 [Deltaproteobacteria bacterium]|nr:hypothetical protein [Deltaproteobacteria bacterium]